MNSILGSARGFGSAFNSNGLEVFRLERRSRNESSLCLAIGKTGSSSCPSRRICGFFGFIRGVSARRASIYEAISCSIFPPYKSACTLQTITGQGNGNQKTKKNLTIESLQD